MQANESASRQDAGAASLKHLLQVQESSVVSRVLLKGTNGSVTLFAFGEGEGLSEHTSPFDALVIGVEGEAEIQISGSKCRLQEGESIRMPANQPHAIHATNDFKMLLVMLKP